MKKSELQKIIKEELKKILSEGGSFDAKVKSKYDIRPRVQTAKGGSTDMFKTPYLVIWLNGGSQVYVHLKSRTEEVDNKTAQAIADYLATEIDKIVDNIPKKFK